MSMTVSFPGGTAVDAAFHGHIIHTDQPAPLGANAASSPFDLFLASIGTCMGFYALRFCQERGIDSTGLSLEVDPRRDESGKHVGKIEVSIQLPAGFPEKYKDAIRRATETCAVKYHLQHPPEFAITLEP